ncbi:hypothetical protein [Zhongshania sp.]|uniref:hypothetical protein n=1 Tax=Zhongshania sp. TaxID=1971902 RepID=UPI0039E32119
MNEDVRMLLERCPILYLRLLHLKRRGHWSRPWVVSKETDCVIDGFPRSANSFAYATFFDSQKDKGLHIATHTHSPAQIVQAVRWGVPTMLCIRAPKDAVRGLLSFEIELDLRQRNADASNIVLPDSSRVRKALRRWHFFHSNILPYRNDIFVAHFERIISEFDKVSMEFCDWSGKDWSAWDSVRITEESIKGKAFHVGPNPLREMIKTEVDLLLNKESFLNLLDKCDRVYEHYLNADNRKKHLKTTTLS